MKRYKYFYTVILLFLSLNLFSNEKTSQNEKIFLNSNFSFNNVSNTKSNTENKIDPENEALFKRIYGYLAVGITGIILTCLSVPSAIGFTILMAYVVPCLLENLFIPYLLMFSIPFLAAGIPLIIYGFINYNRFKFYLKKKNSKSGIKNNSGENLISISFEVKYYSCPGKSSRY